MNRTIRVMALLCGLLLSAGLVQGLGATPADAFTNQFDWPNWRGPDHNGISKETNWTHSWPGGGPKLLWRTNIGTGFSSIAVSEGRVFTMGNRNNQDTVFCFGLEKGQRHWSYSYPAPMDPHHYEGGPSTTPTVDEQRVYVLSRRGDLFCFESADGKVVWKKNISLELDLKLTDWGFAGSPLIQGDLLILNVGDAGAAVNKKSGRVIWSTGKGKAGYATPVPFQIDRQAGVLIFAAKSLVAVETRSGNPMWSFPWETDFDINAADPIVSGNKIFISSGYGSGGGLVEIKEVSQRLVWKNENMHNHFNSSVLLDDHLYGASGQSGRPSDLRCVEWATGKLKWTDGSVGLGSVMAAGDRLVVLSEDGELIIARADPTKFKALGRAKVLEGKCWTVPVLSNGRFLCRNADGQLMCFDLRNKNEIARVGSSTP